MTVKEMGPASATRRAFSALNPGEYKVADFIYDGTDGACVARIENGSVFNNTNEKIAYVADDRIYGLDDQLIGYLASISQRSPLPEKLKMLLSESTS